MAQVNQTPLLEMRGVSKSFGATRALAGVDLCVHPGEVLALVGENGAGKSTLMKILSGALAADSGEILLRGAPFFPDDPLSARRAGVAMIYQELSLAPHLTVEENINLGLEPKRAGIVRLKDARDKAAKALAELGHSEIPPQARVRDLAPAVRQLVEIARALAHGAEVIVLDEPTSSLPQGDMEKLFEVVRRLKGQGRAIVYISHFLEEVLEVSDRFTVLRDGAVAGGGNTADADAAAIVSLMVGRSLDEMYVRSEREPGEVVLELEEVAGSMKPDSASLTLHRGEVLGIAGLVGAGRTELLRAVFGLDPVKSGQVKIGAYVGPASPARRWAQSVGFLSEDRKGEGLALNLDLADNMTLTRLSGLGPLGFIHPRKQRHAAQKWIDALAIKSRGPRQKAGELSGGNQQKAALARLLHHDVDVLLLDEPTRGIDVGSKAQIYRLIDDLVAGRGGKKKAALMVSSYLPELLGVCDRVAVMCRGRLLPARTAGDIDERCVMMEATGQGGPA